jgi:hypothetical protein
MSLLTGGLHGEDDDHIDAQAAIGFLLWSDRRKIQLLEKLCKAWGVKDP